MLSTGEKLSEDFFFFVVRVVKLAQVAQKGGIFPIPGNKVSLDGALSSLV